jgi:hypothetical protein
LNGAVIAQKKTRVKTFSWEKNTITK